MKIENLNKRVEKYNEIKRMQGCKSRFSEFSNDEIYMLSRQSIESSANIVLMDSYSKEECKIHNNLMNELSEERKKRNI